MLLPLLLLASLTAGLHIHGNAIHLSARIPEEKVGRLWVLQSATVPDNVHGYLGHHTFIVSNLTGVQGGNISELHPEVSPVDTMTDSAAQI
jgi:hypothetical protein